MTESATPTVEQGIKVFQISDYEWIAADSLDSAISCALKEWGMTREEAFGDGIDRIEEPEDYPCDLDNNLVNIDENESPKGEKITYREEIKRMIARGQQFPCFFAWQD